MQHTAHTPSSPQAGRSLHLRNISGKRNRLTGRAPRLPEASPQMLTVGTLGLGERKACTQRELESLVGQLHHTCKVVRPGRTLLQRMIDLLSATGPTTASYCPHHHIRLNREFRADLAFFQDHGMALANSETVSQIQASSSPLMSMAPGAVGHGMGPTDSSCHCMRAGYFHQRADPNSDGSCSMGPEMEGFVHHLLL